jgi:molecular chaperone DnaK
LVFQTEKQLKEFGEKLSDGNKTAIQEALEKLKAAHQAQDLSAIEPAIENLNKAWEGASQEMYSSTQGDAAQGAPGADSTSSTEGTGDGVSDVDYEEVNDEGKK